MRRSRPWIKTRIGTTAPASTFARRATSPLSLGSATSVTTVCHCARPPATALWIRAMASPRQQARGSTHACERLAFCLDAACVRAGHHARAGPPSALPGHPTSRCDLGRLDGVALNALRAAEALVCAPARHARTHTLFKDPNALGNACAFISALSCATMYAALRCEALSIPTPPHETRREGVMQARLLAGAHAPPEWTPRRAHAALSATTPRPGLPPPVGVRCRPLRGLCAPAKRPTIVSHCAARARCAPLRTRTVRAEARAAVQSLLF